MQKETDIPEERKKKEQLSGAMDLKEWNPHEVEMENQALDINHFCTLYPLLGLLFSLILLQALPLHPCAPQNKDKLPSD